MASNSNSNSNSNAVSNSVYEWVEWMNTWTDVSSFGYLVHSIPIQYDSLVRYCSSSHNKKYRNDIIELGLVLFGTNDHLKIMNYCKNIEYTYEDQQPSITHSIYIISKDVKKNISICLDELFQLYRDGHSVLHSIASPFELENSSNWCKRVCEYGFVYHHPDYICYLITSYLKDRPYQHIVTNSISSYHIFYPDHSITFLNEDLNFNFNFNFTPDSKVVFVMNSYLEEFPTSIIGSILDYDTPICFYGIIPYIIPRLPERLFELQLHYLFDDTDQFSFYILRGVYTELPEHVQEYFTRECEPILDLSDDLTEEDGKKIVLAFLPEEWKKDFYANPYKLVKFTKFSWKNNLIITKYMNQLLFHNHEKKTF
jgi:hypothetical protein